MDVCMHFYISGKVQGVWYRASARQKAEEMEITGWAQNLADGRVEVMACGEQDQLEIFAQWLKQGPELAEVTHLSQEEIPWKEFAGFLVK